MGRFATREGHFALREALILALAGVAAFLFLNHENLYLTGPFTLSKAPLEAYFLVTTVTYRGPARSSCGVRNVGNGLTIPPRRAARPITASN